MKKNPFQPRIDTMHFPVPEDAILARLGYSRWRTVLPEAEKQRIRSLIAAHFQLCRPLGCWTALQVTEQDENGIRLENGSHIPSKKVSARYPEAAWMWFGAVTIGPALPEKSAALMQSGHSAEAVIADAVGGECADGAMDFLQKQAAGALMRHGLYLADKRFSPGYGDWDLQAQKNFFEILPMEEMGIRLTESMLMVPEKSVTAVAGIVCGSK
jgi:hypothetical protein